MRWVEAVKAWNAKHGGKYHIPRKGTAEHAEVMAMMGSGACSQTGAGAGARARSESPEPKRFIQEVVAKMKKGAMTKTAKRHGETPLEYAKEVLAHPEKHTLTMRRRAQFLVNINKE
jgi:hypothetical protein